MQIANIDLSAKNVPPIFYAMEGDTDRQIQILLYDGSATYDASGDALSVWYDNGAGNAGSFSDCVSVAGNAVTITLPGNLTGVPGRYGLAVVISNTDGKISTWKMGVIVSSVPGYGSAAAGEYFEAFQAGELAQKIAAVNARVSNIIASGTPTEGNTELIDIRTGYDGLNYKTAGDSVRGQSSELNDLFDVGKNLANPNRVILKKVLNTSGVIQASNDFNTYYGIPVTKGETYDFITPCRVYVVLNKNIIPENTNPDANVIDSNSSVNLVKEFSPSETGFLLFSVGSDVEPCVCVHGDLVEFEKYRKVPKGVLENEEEIIKIDSEVKSVKTDVEKNKKVIEKIGRISSNIVDPKIIKENLEITVYGDKKYTTAPSSRYDSVLDLPLSGGKTYSIMPTRCYQILSGDSVVYASFENKDSSWEYTPESDCTISFSYYKKYSDSVYVSETEISKNYEEYNKLLYTEEFIKLFNPLYGKTIYNFGDSVSNGAGNLVNGKYIGPAEITANKYGMVCTDYAVSGASMANPDDENPNMCIMNQIESASSEQPDFVLLAGGINDLKFTTAGEMPAVTGQYSYSEEYIDSLDVSKFAGAFEKAIFTVTNKWVGTQLIYMFEHKMLTHYSDGTQNLHDVALKICEKWCIPVLDMWEEGGLNLAIRSHLLKYGSTTTGTGTVIDGVTYDGTHCNGEGYETFYVPKLRFILLKCCRI